MEKSCKSHDHGHGGGCSHGATNEYYIPRDEMTSIDKLLDDQLFKSKTFFKSDNYKNMHEILKAINQSFKHIIESGKKTHGEPPEDVRKQIVTKCIFESLNRHIFAAVKGELLKKEEMISQAPVLLASPETLRNMARQRFAGANAEEMNEQIAKVVQRLDQKTLEELNQSHYAYQKEFFKDPDMRQKLKGCYEKLVVLEVEGKFQLNKDPRPEK